MCVIVCGNTCCGRWEGRVLRPPHSYAPGSIVQIGLQNVSAGATAVSLPVECAGHKSPEWGGVEWNGVEWRRMERGDVAKSSMEWHGVYNNQSVLYR